MSERRAMAKPKILIVEDSPQNIRILMEVLQDDFTIITAINGEKGLDLAGREPVPDIVLLDILLPGIDGYAVCAQLKANPKTKDIPVLFVTAVSETMDETKAFQLGGVDYITKPYHPPTVKARVKTHLELKRYREKLEEMVQMRTAELEKAGKIAMAANEAKGRFISNMSHELQTPMNGIIAAADLALSYELPEQVVPIIQTIKKSGTTLTTVFSNIIEYSKAKNSALEMARMPFQLDELLNGLPRVVLQKGVEKAVDLSFERQSATIPNDLIGDAGHLGEIFTLLIDNAAKFTNQHPVVAIGIDIADQTDRALWLKFSVKDNGIGIASQDHENIFNAFFQVDSSSIRHFDGLGLGLPICKQLVQLMSGHIWLESQPGQGSTFYFTVELQVQLNTRLFVLPSESEPLVPPTAASSEEGTEAPPLDLNGASSIVDQLTVALSEMNPEHVGRRLLILKPYLSPLAYEKLQHLVKAYEYEQALILLRDLVEKSKV